MLKKKLLSGFLAACLAFGGNLAQAFPLGVSAAAVEEINADLVYGDFKYSVDEDDDTITITGYTGSGTTVNIPSKINGKSVTSIGYCAFANCKSITSITIPNSVTDIADFT